MSGRSHPSSFRDPAGFIFESDGRVYRQINKAGKDDYDLFMKGGLYQRLARDGLIIPHQETDDKLASGPEAYKVIQAEKIPFVSYPYEWSFSQLKSAAILTLKVQRLALEHGMILKDASAYNVQSIGKNAVFIDTLSFRKYKSGEAWDGYKQFCEHFLAPLALAVYNSPEFLRAQKAFIDGIPLPVAVTLLPRRSKWSRGMFSHIYLHAASQRRYDNAGHSSSKKVRRISPLALQGLMHSLEAAVRRLKTSPTRSEWGDYYNDTNYTDKAFGAKRQIVRDLLEQIPARPEIVWDLGANDGTFSEIAAKMGAYTVSFDIDMNAVERNYTKDVLADKVLPLVMDLSNPSPALGWGHTERLSLQERGPADAVLALALIHHLAIGNNLPLNAVADYFAHLTRYLIIEFVPKEDSKVQLLLASRRDIFESYHQKGFEKAFGEKFKLLDKKAVAGSKRVIYLYQAKAK